MSTSNELEVLYNLRNKFLIIGLTGRLGSGCTTVANYLGKQKFDECNFPVPKTTGLQTNEDRKYKIVYNYLRENWKPFKLVRASNVITALVLMNTLEEVQTFLISQYKDSDVSNYDKVIIEICDNIRIHYDSLSKKVKEVLKKNNTDYVYKLKNKLNPSKHENIHGEIIDSEITDAEIIELFLGEENLIKGSVCENLTQFSKILKHEFTKLKSKTKQSPFQLFGDNIRKTGNSLDNDNAKFKTRNSFIISEIINQLVKIYRKENGKIAHIVIDSIRNSMEAKYFKERFSAFYLFAINTENEYRKGRLSDIYNGQELKNLDNEYNKKLKPEEIFYYQDIKTCIQVADIYLYNPNDNSGCGDTHLTIKKNLVRYLSLILQPGIITPTPQERCMQIAYTAKYNSGCISRQVGAVVTDNTFSVKSIGWNNTPEGQTPCLLRSVDDLRNNSDSEAFSEYEKNEEIRPLIEKTLEITSEQRDSIKGRNLSFCFKEAQNCLEHEKNQVHTRSLHAEENAMLQISKYGGEGLRNGFLFTTASPCELCSKKAYQLNITKVFYIDPYPGIANDQILKSGVAKHQPQLELFIGAIGRAYHNLFEPFMSYKDELNIILKYSYQKTHMGIIDDKEGIEKEIHINRLKKIQKEAKNDLEKLKPLLLADKVIGIKEQLDDLKSLNVEEFTKLMKDYNDLNLDVVV